MFIDTLTCSNPVGKIVFFWASTRRMFVWSILKTPSFGVPSTSIISTSFSKKWPCSAYNKRDEMVFTYIKQMRKQPKSQPTPLPCQYPWISDFLLYESVTRKDNLFLCSNFEIQPSEALKPSPASCSFASSRVLSRKFLLVIISPLPRSSSTRSWSESLRSL